MLVAGGLLAPAYALPAPTPDPTDQTNGEVYAVAYSGDTIYIGGAFSAVRPAGATKGGVTRNNIAAIDAGTGTVVMSFNPDVNGAVHAITVGTDGTVYFGGEFTSVGGQSRTRLAAATSGGALTGWAPPANATVLALDTSGSRVYIGGRFGTLGGKRRPNLGAANTTGSVLAWNPRPSGRVEALVAVGSSIYLGGNFTSVGGTATAKAAKVDSTGALVAAWKPNVSYLVMSMAVANGAVYLAQGGPGGRVQAVDATTGADKWTVRTDGGVQAVDASSTTVYVGGHFSTITGVARQKIAALKVDDGSVLSWDPGANQPHGVWALSVSGTRLGVGGEFTVTGGTAQQGFAQYSGDSV
jgi:hypothetical protein